MGDGTTPEQVRTAQQANLGGHGVSMDDPDTTFVAVDATAPESFAACGLRMVVDRLLQDLGPDDRELLRLRFVHEQTQSLSTSRPKA
jgi:hypothetical protein